MNLEDQLDIYLRARFTLIVLITPEEDRALNFSSSFRGLKNSGKNSHYSCFSGSIHPQKTDNLTISSIKISSIYCVEVCSIFFGKDLAQVFYFDHILSPFPEG